MDTLPTYFMFMLSRKSTTQPAQIQYTKIVSQRSKHSKWHWDRPQLINIEVIRGMHGGHILQNNNRISRKMYLLLSDNIHQTGQTRSWSPAAGGRHLMVVFDLDMGGLNNTNSVSKDSINIL